MSRSTSGVRAARPRSRAAANCAAHDSTAGRRRTAQAAASAPATTATSTASAARRSGAGNPAWRTSIQAPAASISTTEPV